MSTKLNSDPSGGLVKEKEKLLRQIQLALGSKKYSNAQLLDLYDAMQFARTRQLEIEDDDAARHKIYLEDIYKYLIKINKSMQKLGRDEARMLDRSFMMANHDDLLWKSEQYHETGSAFAYITLGMEKALADRLQDFSGFNGRSKTHDCSWAVEGLLKRVHTILPDMTISSKESSKACKLVSCYLSLFSPVPAKGVAATYIEHVKPEVLRWIESIKFNKDK